MTQRHRTLGALLALAALTVAPGCYVLMPIGLAVEPAPVLDGMESPDLLGEVQGTLVVVDGSRELLVISYPGGEQRRIPTEGRAFAASAIDAEGRLVYVRMERPWWELGIGKRDYALVLKSLGTGVERELGPIASSKDGSLSQFRVGLAGGRALCTFRGRQPRVFELSTGNELDLSWWEERVAALSLTADGSTVIARASGTWAEPADRLVEIDLGSGRSRPLASSHFEAFDLEGRPVELSWGMGESGTEPSEPPGWMGLPGLLISDRLVIHEGIASPASQPRSGSGLSSNSFEHSVRIADLPTGRTATLVPRFSSGSYAFSSFPLPALQAK